MPRTHSAKTAVSRKPKASHSIAARNVPAAPHTPTVQDHIRASMQADQGIPKAEASTLFSHLAGTSSLPAGKIRAKLIPDSSWKRAGKRLGPQASQTTARLRHVLALATRVWGKEKDATAWLNNPHPELRGDTPLSLLRTEAGGRAVETLLAALEFGFPV
jgi:putative toxin-antitoxin system antitoxin component (TIGR02293 family)